LATVQAGERVVAGQVVGSLIDVGGHCASTCLHLGARRGEQYVDPALLLGWRAPRLLPLTGPGTL
jgi:murein DD-endopeptidase MepM/ murein hydrolase activator NlpD